MSMTQAQVEAIALWHEPSEDDERLEHWDEYVDEYLRSTSNEDQSESDLCQYLEAF